MANKSNLSVAIDNGSGVILQIESDASGYMAISMNDGSKTLALKLQATDMHVLRNAISYADALRSQIPQS